MPDFTGSESRPSRSRPPTTGNAEIDQRIATLVKAWGGGDYPDLIQEMLGTVLRIGHDGLGMADLKLFVRSLKELRRAARIFAPYRAIRKVVVFGSARIQPGDEAYVAAEAFARKMRQQGYMIITGGGDGIMGAAQKGAGRENSFGLNIRLPFEQRANETIDGDSKLINFNYFFTRKVNFMKEAHAVVLFPGGFGTLDEGFEMLTLMQTGKARILPLVMVDSPGGNYWKTWFSFLAEYLLKLRLISQEDFSLFKRTDSVDEAVAEILGFYKNFHSYRWVGTKMVIRLHNRLTREALADLNHRFSDLLKQGKITQGRALPEESSEPEIWKLPRLLLTPHKREFGGIRRLVDAINAASVKKGAE